MDTPKKRGKRRAGFTLSEVLMVVGILAVLIAVAVPSFFALQRNWQQAELDATARQLFISVQNRLVGLKSAGQIGELSNKGSVDTSTGARYLLDTDKNISLLLPKGMVEEYVRGNHYLISFNPASGAVTEVFYAKKAISAQQAFTMRGEENKNQRHESQLGYYNGTDLNIESAKPLDAPKITLNNREELTALVQLPSSYVPGSFLLELEAGDGHALVQLEQRRVDGGIDAVNRTATVVLDSLAHDADGLSQQFKDLFAGLAPGGDITLTARLTYIGGDKLYLPSTAFAQGNSLFGQVSAGVASVGWGRHLQNLDAQISGVTGVTGAMQTAVIDFGASSQWQSAYPGRTFTPITNAELTRYNGSELPIRHLRVDGGAVLGTKTGFGLFETFGAPGSMMQNIRIENPSISGETGVGALAGSVYGGTVQNCMAYVAPDEAANATLYGVTGKAEVGGLIGLAVDTVISESACGLPSVQKTAFAGTVGALAGSLTNCTVRACYGAADQLTGLPTGDAGAGYAGMFAGRIEGGSVTDCYATGNMQGTLGTVGGFSGEGGNVLRSYCAVGYTGLAGGQSVYAFTKDGTLSECAYLEVTGTTVQASGGASKVTYDVLSDRTIPLGDAWSRLGKGQSFPYSLSQSGTAYPFPALKQAAGLRAHYGSWPEKSKATNNLSLAYYEMYQDASQGGAAAPLTYGYWADFGSGGLVDTLASAGEKGAVLRDGYALISKFAPPSGFSVTVDGVKVTGLKWETISLPVGGAGTKQLYLAKLPETITDSQNGGYTAFYQQVVATGGEWNEKLFFSPYFAKSQLAPGASAPSLPGLAYIRTPRHLWRLAEATGQNPNLFGTCSFLQELDLNYASYLDRDWTITNQNDKQVVSGTAYSQLTQKSISGPDGFKGTYLGSKKTIRGLRLPAQGLFIGISGKLSELTLSLNLASSIAPSSGSDFGFLAGTVKGSIINAGVEVLAVQTISGSPACLGGVAGRVTGGGSLQGCSFQLRSVGLSFAGTAGGVAGIVLQGARIESCSAEMRGSASFTGSFAGGLVGTNAGDLSQCRVEFSGSSNRISAQNAGGLAGLSSGQVTGCTVTGGAQARAILTGPQSSNAFFGGLIGVMDGGTLTKSKVVAGGGGFDLTAIGNTGGAIGELRAGSVDDCFVRPDDTVQGYDRLSVTGGSTGGFAYSVLGGARISKCYAVGVVNAGQSGVAGGFIGRNVGTVSQSYANCKTTGGYAAGFVYDHSGPSISNCYALLEVKGYSGSAGFAYFSSNKIRNSYSAVRMAKPSGAAWYGGFVAQTLAGTLENCVYLQSGVSGQLNSAVDGTPVTYDDLNVFKGDLGMWDWAVASTTHPYDQTGVFPFSKLTGLEHWGDWPLAPSTAVGMFYYEQYADGTYGVYAVGSQLVSKTEGLTFETVAPVRSLLSQREGGTGIVKTGYGVFYSNSDIKLKDWTIDGTAIDKLNATAAPFTDPNYTFKIWPSVEQKGSATYTLEYKHDQSGQRETSAGYVVDPRFAQAIAVPKTGESFVWASTAPAVVRTQGQLEGLRALPSGSFIQGYDITLSGFTGLTSFAGAYNGQSCRIANLTVPLLGQNTGSIQNLNLSGQIAGSGDLGFIRTNAGNLTQVRSEGKVTYGSTGGSVGGLVGVNNVSGVIYRCSSGAQVSSTVPRSTTVNTGGLVGLSAGKIEQSYTTANVTATSGGTGATGWTGGFVGQATGGSIRECYTQSAVSGFGNGLFGAWHTGQFAGNQTGGSVIRNAYSTSGWGSGLFFFGSHSESLASGVNPGWYIYCEGLGNLITKWFRENDSIALSQGAMGVKENFSTFDFDSQKIWEMGPLGPTLAGNPPVS